MEETRRLEAITSAYPMAAADYTVALGLQYKYSATALLLFMNRCAMYCRHCSRERFF
ncbi:MAG TPA: hypothetical protein H9775_00455 [Candidatus Blautia merdipullorum]|nr:hypothetical protein [Candidatus Blautia merdipullorum]